MRRLKVRTLWIIIAIVFVLTLGCLIWCPYAPDGFNKVLIVFMAIGFISLTFLVQYASFRTFRYKNKIKYPKKEYTCDIDIMDKLIKLKFKKRIAPYGESYLLIDGNVAYKVVLVNDCNVYFNNPNNDEVSSPNKALDKCKKFIAFELFYDMNEEAERKIVDFSIQGEKVYYTAFVKTEKGFICPNYVEADDNHKDNYNKLIEMLEFKNIEE